MLSIDETSVMREHIGRAINRTLEIDADSLTFFIRSPGIISRKVCTQKSNNVSVLFQLFGNAKKTIFFDGRVVDPSQTFESIGAENMSRFVMIDIKNLSFQQETFWKKATRSDRETIEKFQILNDPLCFRELTKITDLKMTRIEERKVGISMLTRMNWIMGQDSPPLDPIQSVTEYENKLNDTPLPTLWWWWVIFLFLDINQECDQENRLDIRMKWTSFS
jgi:hypothetical protein